MAINIRHRHIRKIWPLPNPGAELSHQQGVGTQIVEKVTVDRYLIRTHDICKQVRKLPLDVNGRAAARAEG
ncbi:hypothetical protein GCM10009608_59410 [Pseudonocardia alaniniphila]